MGNLNTLYKVSKDLKTTRYTKYLITNRNTKSYKNQKTEKKEKMYRFEPEIKKCTDSNLRLKNVQIRT